MDVLDHNLKATLVVIREELMAYFKGDCVERLASGPVVLHSTAQRPQYSYQRRHIEITRPCKLLLGGVRLFNLRCEPNVIVFNLNALERSPQLREIRHDIEQLVDSYLPDVTKEYTGAKPNSQRDDSVLVQNGEFRNKETEEFYEPLVDILQEQNYVFVSPLHPYSEELPF